jgi:RNA-splicing ligase RtcB
MIEFKGKYTTAKVMIDEIDETCAAQITGFINHPAFTNPVAIMPDCHAGAGSVIGFTMPLPDKVIPNTIGVDIGCGMLSCNLGEVDKSDLDMEAIDKEIRARVPFGFEVRKVIPYNMEIGFPFARVHETGVRFWREFNKRFGTDYTPPSKAYTYKWFEMLCGRIGLDIGRAINSLGSLGGGNHFIELGYASTGSLWATVHSGSRQLGLKTCNYWQKRPTERKHMEMKTAYSEGIHQITQKYKGKEIDRQIKKLRAELGMDNKMAKGLDYIEDIDMYGYLIDMIFAQCYAQENRRIIMNQVCHAFGKTSVPTDHIETVHNYIDFNDFVIRKGAISAHKGEMMLIPFNMRDGILVCKGKGNEEWNNSAPHGAGRVFSRSEAKRTLSVDEFKEEMSSVFSTSVNKNTLDESPMAYKDSSVIEEAIGPTAEIIDKIVPIMNLKDG